MDVYILFARDFALIYEIFLFYMAFGSKIISTKKSFSFRKMLLRRLKFWFQNFEKLLRLYLREEICPYGHFAA